MLRYYYMFLGLFVMMLIGCASTAPLPATLNIVPPSPDVPKEIAAFSGVWEGSLRNGIDTILVVEKIDNKKAEIIISYGAFGGYAPSYYYYTADVTSIPSIEFTEPDGDKYIFTLDKSLTKMNRIFFEEETKAPHRAYLSRKTK
ncbi:MAG: hypothetical protein HY807_00450 [Nitrospirae bacterium]|nr:hypothetical protein [Nitrospirota bacterium]